MQWTSGWPLMGYLRNTSLDRLPRDWVTIRLPVSLAEEMLDTVRTVSNRTLSFAFLTRTLEIPHLQ